MMRPIETAFYARNGAKGEIAFRWGSLRSRAARMRWRMKSSICVLMASLCLCGCETTKERVAREMRQFYDTPDASGLTRREFMERAKSLEVGMRREDVAALLGQPMKTSLETFGTATAKPWNGLMWKYSRDLCVVFQPWYGDWRVIHWR